MARGNTKREGRAARSELPSGVEATKSEIAKMSNDSLNLKYRNNWDGNTKPQTAGGGLKVGDGQVGNGIIKDGKLHLRDEDIKSIVEKNFDAEACFDIIDNGGAGNLAFTPLTGDSNVLPKGHPDEDKASGYTYEMGTWAFDLPSGDDFSVEDFEGGERATRDNPGESASGTIILDDDADVDADYLRIDYEKSTNMPVERESMERLATAIDKHLKDIVKKYEVRKSENYDWDDYGDRRAEDSYDDWRRDRDDQERERWDNYDPFGGR